MAERSYKPLSEDDLRRLALIAKRDRQDLFRRKPELGALYKDAVICVTLCQGAALHYYDRRRGRRGRRANGIKDFDVWTFFYQGQGRPFPYRRNVARDFGDPKFGKSHDSPQFIGRRVDCIGRSIPGERSQSIIDLVQHYLMNSNNKSPKLLRQKAVIGLAPASVLGEVIWPTP